MRVVGDGLACAEALRSAGEPVDGDSKSPRSAETTKQIDSR